MGMVSKCQTINNNQKAKKSRLVFAVQVTNCRLTLEEMIWVCHFPFLVCGFPAFCASSYLVAVVCCLLEKHNQIRSTNNPKVCVLLVSTTLAAVGARLCG